MTRVNIIPKVRQQMRVVGLSRTAVVRLYSWIYDELENRAKKHRHNRAALHAGCFIVRKLLLDGTVIHHCGFIVNDQSPEVFRVEDFTHHRGKSPGSP